jgi:glycerophosphoryl diester phosphodiesterase
MQGTDLFQSGKRTRLKWHRLRRSMSDPEFSAEVMAEGFRIGASMELDLQVRADGGFAVLHDETLERETKGQGRVADLDGAALSVIPYRQQTRPLILTEELADLLPKAHPEALLQFDMKNDLAQIGLRGVAHLADHLADRAGAIIFSGACLDLIQALGQALPGARRGIDPTDRLLDLWRLEGPRVVEAALLAELRGGTDPHMVYLQWEMVLALAVQGLDLVALAQAEGVAVDAWTHRLTQPDMGFTEAEWPAFRALMALGPDQITTDEAVATEAAWRARREGGDGLDR